MIHNHYGTKDERKKSRKRIAAGKRAWATRMQRANLKKLFSAPSVLEANASPQDQRLSGLSRPNQLRFLVTEVFDILSEGSSITSAMLKQEGVGEASGHIDGSTFLLTITRY